jgi:CTP:phosphocholine cytidylyltransferase-like protein
LEGKKLEEQLQILKEEDEEKAKIAKGYLKDMFKQADTLL